MHSLSDQTDQTALETSEVIPLLNLLKREIESLKKAYQAYSQPEYKPSY